MILANFKKAHLVFGMLVFLLLFLFNTRPAFHCQVSPDVHVSAIADATNLPVIYGITPTYARLTQKADLTRLSQTLMHVKNFHWIVIEDSETKTPLVERFLQRSGLKYTHLFVKTHKSKNSYASGVEQRNLALSWLKEYLAELQDPRGVIYFMDDDNTYDLRVFEEMRKINKVGVWPVGIVGGMRVELPIVQNGKIVGYNAIWKPFRPFPIDMAGFAINSSLLLEHPDAKFSRKVQSGFQESVILRYFVTKTELEPLAENCTQVYVWHTRTAHPSIIKPQDKQPPANLFEHIEV